MTQQPTQAPLVAEARKYLLEVERDESGLPRWRADLLVEGLARQLEQAKETLADLEDTEDYEIIRWRRRVEQAEREKERLRRLLQECYGWMNGVEPKPAQPFLDAVQDATKPSGEVGEEA